MTVARKAGLRIAVLIDADAVGADAMDEVMAEASREGTIIVARAWRHWDKGQRKSWADAMKKHEICEGRQAPGRNATDIALAIDAIDLLHERAIDGVCVVSNDRDYEPLAARLRRSGRRAVFMTNYRKVFEACGAVWDHRVWLRKEVEAQAPIPVSPTNTVKDASVEAYRAALASLPQDNGWVRATELGKAVEQRELRMKPLVKWLKSKPDFEVATRAFEGKDPAVDCVRLRCLAASAAR